MCIVLPFIVKPASFAARVNVRAAFAFCSMLVAIVSGAEIGIGDAREEVLRQLGKPTSIARRGDHEILLYPKGGRVELVNGKVADVKGPLPVPALPTVALAPPPASTTPTTDPATTTTTPVSPPLVNEPPTVTSSGPTPSAIPSADYNPAVAANELAKHVEKMDTAWGMAPPKVDDHSPFDSVPEFLTGLLLRFGFTVVALKLAFKYWEMDAFWKGVFIIAGIDLALHASFELLGQATNGLTTMVAVENGIPGLVMIYTIHRFCFNKRIQNAVVTAAAVKLVVTLFYIFAGVATLNVIYG